MSLQLALLIIVTAAAAALAVGKWHAFACADLDRLRQQEHWVGRFARGSRLLMDDDRVPQSFLETLAGLNAAMLDRSSTLLLYKVFTSPDRPSQSTALNSDGTPFYEGDDALAQLVSETLFAAIMATSYADLRSGERARGAMARLYKGQAQVTDLASVAAREVTRSDHSLPPDLVAA
ncbi:MULTISPECIES: hypothetical protein [Methylorubrum]|uniref:hypothetical protein n=1 Tax=Methylorubrum TaxID=2282523 RepID=UPI00209F926A|nr:MULTISPECIES: hypothetical protein [Methylorubrum]MCP1550732.1 hypothetical protein [Methylorubrum zatmanii]MCP1552655.1 hypothetical protein [Methylorubrum extorquens]MCP1581035.1 hypothetical protein [Methylorubrum extorquens]